MPDWMLPLAREESRYTREVGQEGTLGLAGIAASQDRHDSFNKKRTSKEPESVGIEMREQR